ncbi:hypothetical protein ACXU4B_09225 [Dyella soli]|uniref:Transposase IS4-like domain-containing protein n=1 Tax=Dyella soli TaxID=522319 RepID=A0A4R0YQ77_9GAMM|nr:hypothetical protein [Dyella soli]TCI11119.1 hypothetical protein EZM97_20115 [Dyella soli]
MSYGPEDGGDDGDGFQGQTCRNVMHASSTGPGPRLIRIGRGNEAKASYLANALLESRIDLIVAVDLGHASSTSEREGTLDLPTRAGVKACAAMGADKGSDQRDFDEALKRRGIQAQIARNTKGRHSSIDGRIVRSNGYEICL